MELNSNFNEYNINHSPVAAQRKDPKFKKKLLNGKITGLQNTGSILSNKGTPIGTTKSCNIKQKTNEKNFLRENYFIPRTSTNKESVHSSNLTKTSNVTKTPNSKAGYTFFKVSNEKDKLFQKNCFGYFQL